MSGKHTFSWVLVLVVWLLICVFGIGLVSNGNEREDTFLLKGTDLEISMTRIRTQKEGPLLFIVAGLHGDEEASWRAADQMRNLSIQSGEIVIISPANPFGAKNLQRLTQDGYDVNRCFPGISDGSDGERIGDAIYQQIKEDSPNLVLDLHEASGPNSLRDELGNSIICASQEKIGNLVLRLLTASKGGQLGSTPLTLYGSPPPGSINRVVWEELGIPVLTVETDREDPLLVRETNHIEIVRFVLDELGMND